MDDNSGNDKNLTELLNRTITLQHRYMHHKAHGRHGDPNRGQSRILSILKIKPEISQKDLCYLLDMRSQSLGELLVKLERAGYITRRSSEEDHRVMIIRLTETGETAAAQAEHRQADSGRLFDCLSEEEQGNLAAYLKRLIEKMEREMDAAGDARAAHRKSYHYDPFWGVGDGLSDAKDCCRRYKHAAKEYSREAHRQYREHKREIQDEVHERVRRLREELRGAPGFRSRFHGAGECGAGCEQHCDKENYGNGSRPKK